jgi:hypothetical protein
VAKVGRTARFSGALMWRRSEALAWRSSEAPAWRRTWRTRRRVRSGGRTVEEWVPAGVWRGNERVRV